jgi:hypothetical protein
MILAGIDVLFSTFEPMKRATFRESKQQPGSARCVTRIAALHRMRDWTGAVRIGGDRFCP